MIRRMAMAPALLPLLVGLAAACESPTELPLVVPTSTLEAVGDAMQLTAHNADGGLPLWESLDTTVVTVTPAGMAVAVAPGTAAVRARLGSRTAEGTVVVMEPVEILISDLDVVVDSLGQFLGMKMRLKNAGGRGFFRVDYWRERGQGEAEHTRVLHMTTDLEALVGMDVQSSNYLMSDPADWVVAYSREPNSLGYVMTSCVRLDGGTPCPMP